MSILELKLSHFANLGSQDSWILDIADDPARPSGVLFNENAMTKIKEASASRCFYLMLDVIHIKSPVAAHMMLILGTTEDGKINQVVYSKVKHKQFNAIEVLDCLECVLKNVWEQSLHQHLLALVADEGPHNVLLREAGFPVLTDLRHLQNRFTSKGHVDVVLEDVHKTCVFEKADYKQKFECIRKVAKDLPKSPWSRTEAELKVLERVVVLRFDVLDTPFTLQAANNNLLERLGRKVATVASAIMAEALTKNKSLKGQLLESHKLLRRVVCLLCLMERLDTDAGNNK